MKCYTISDKTLKEIIEYTIDEVMEHFAYADLSMSKDEFMGLTEETFKQVIKWLKNDVAKKLNFSSNARVCGIAYINENNNPITEVEEELELYDFEFFCPFCYEKLDISYADMVEYLRRWFNLRDVVEFVVDEVLDRLNASISREEYLKMIDEITEIVENYFPEIKASVKKIEMVWKN